MLWNHARHTDIIHACDFSFTTNRLFEEITSDPYVGPTLGGRWEF